MSRPVAASLICTIMLLTACSSSGKKKESGAPRAEVKTGLDRLEEQGFKPLVGKRVGLITNHTGRNRRGRGTAEVLAGAPGVRLEAIFSPEHGFTGASEELSVGSTHVRLSGRSIPVYSLYKGGLAGMRPRPEDLKGLDVLVFDIQDIGTRFYTYLTTMGMALEEAASAGVAFMVLDRPNPINGNSIEGPLLGDMTLRKVTATAYFPVPVRHGLTAGEMARLHNAEVKHPNLTVITMSGWRRELWHDQTDVPWIAPSPNMPDIDAATLYPGIGCFESSNLSVGRGTPAPFRWVGAPWMDAGAVVALLKAAHLPGVHFRAQTFTPSKSVFKGKSSPGVRMTITDRDALKPLEVFAHLAAALRDTHPDFHFRWKETKRMVGTAEFRRLYEAGAGPRALVKLFDAGPKKFKKTRRPFLLYR